MQPMPNRLGLGLRPPLPSYGQGPSMSALAQQQSMHFIPPQAQKQTTLFVGSISGGITDAYLNQLLTVSYYLLYWVSHQEPIPFPPSGMWSYQVIQALNHSRQQTARFWICRV